jgi:hypothetical protein
LQQLVPPAGAAAHLAWQSASEAQGPQLGPLLPPLPPEEPGVAAPPEPPVLDAPPEPPVEDPLAGPDDEELPPKSMPPLPEPPEPDEPELSPQATIVPTANTASHELPLIIATSPFPSADPPLRAAIKPTFVMRMVRRVPSR